jgi:tetratricopeptide (TPR) repeat protein
MQAEDVSVAAAFDLSYQDLTVGQQRLFRRLGLHPGADIDVYAAAALDDTDLRATRRRLGELYDQNLIGEPARGRYRLHDLLREYAWARAADDDDADNQAAIGRLLDYYLHTAVAAGQHVAWRPSIVGPPPQGPAPAWAPEFRTEEEAVAWLGTERANLHAYAGYAAAHGRLVHAVRIPAAMSGFLHTQGHWNEAVTLGQAALAAARTACDRHGQAWTLNQLGLVQWLTGDYPAATASLTQALQLFRDLGDQRGQPWTLDGLGVVQQLTGDCPAAAASLTQALQLARDLGDRRGQAWSLRDLGVVQQRTGDCPAAAASLTQALQLFRDLGDWHGQAGALINLGELLFLSSAYREARGYFAQALGIARDIDTPVEEARALEGIGRCHVQEGNPGQGAADLRQALAIYRRIGAPEAQRVETTLLN